MKKNFRRLTSVLLAVVLVTSVFSILPVQAASDENQSVCASSGTTGDCTWTLDDDGTLTISGNGKMKDYSSWSPAPWGNDITSLIIENGVTNIGFLAFENCTYLENITIPASINKIGFAAFNGCSGINSITISPDNRSYDSRDNCNAIIKTDNNTLVFGCKNTIIPNGITSIDSDAFYYCSELKSIIIPDSVSSIGSSAFRGCSNLTSIAIPNSVTSIESGVFEECISLKSIIMSERITKIERDAFNKCTSLESVTIPDSVTSIGNSAFVNCTSLTSITIPHNVEYIDYGVFSNCTSLETVIIQNGVTSVSDWMFDGCTNIKSVSVPPSVTYIGKYAFSECKNLESITIPDSVTSIGIYAIGYYFDYNIDDYKKVYGFTIYGVKGSRAQTYANSNSFKFIEIEPEQNINIGDLNGDNSVDVLDATVVQKYSVGKENLSEDQLEVADVNNDNNVDILDATEIQKYAVGKITEFKKS